MKKPFWKRWWVWGIAIIVIIVILANLGGGSGSTNPASTSAKADTSTNSAQQSNKDEAKTTTSKSESKPAPKKKEQKPSAPTITAGTYLVGKDIKPGIYKSSGNVIYFARLKDTTGSLDSIIANGNPGDASFYVEIKSTDKAFQTKGGGKWTKIDLDKYKGKPSDTYTDGMYLVGKDIQPGQYKAVKTGAGYWARLKNVSGSMDSIIANGNLEGPGYVTIKSTDFAVQLMGVKLIKQ